MSLFAEEKKSIRKNEIKSLSEQIDHVHSFCKKTHKKKRKKSQTEAYPCVCKRAAFTVEAAVVLPLFVGFLVIILFYFRVLQTEIGIEKAMAYTVRVTAACVKEEESQADLGKMRLIFLERLKREQVPTEYIDGGILGISLWNAETEKKDVGLGVRYEMTAPIGFFGKLTHTAEQKAEARKWAGYSGGNYLGEGYVYITETGEAYHRTKDCAYLDLSIQSVSAQQIENLRNKNGGKYHKCEKCCEKKTSKGTVYITDYGDVYHEEIGCSGLKRTVYLVEIEKVGQRHPCGKCGGN